MKKKYTHLTQEEREQLSVLHARQTTVLFLLVLNVCISFSCEHLPFYFYSNCFFYLVFHLLIELVGTKSVKFCNNIMRIVKFLKRNILYIYVSRKQKRKSTILMSIINL